MGDEDSLIEGLGRLDELQRMGGASRVRRVAHAEDRKAAGNASFKAKELDKAIHNYLGAYTFRNLNNIILSPLFARRRDLAAAGGASAGGHAARVRVRAAR